AGKAQVFCQRNQPYSKNTIRLLNILIASSALNPSFMNIAMDENGKQPSPPGVEFSPPPMLPHPQQFSQRASGQFSQNMPSCPTYSQEESRQSLPFPLQQTMHSQLMQSQLPHPSLQPNPGQILSAAQPSTESHISQPLDQSHPPFQPSVFPWPTASVGQPSNSTYVQAPPGPPPPWFTSQADAAQRGPLIHTTVWQIPNHSGPSNLTANQYAAHPSGQNHGQPPHFLQQQNFQGGMPPFPPHAPGGHSFAEPQAVHVGQIQNQSLQRAVSNQLSSGLMSNQTMQYESNPLQKSISSQSQDKHEDGNLRHLQKPSQEKPLGPQEDSLEQSVENISEEIDKSDQPKPQRENKRKSRWDPVLEQNQAEEHGANESVKSSCSLASQSNSRQPQDAFYISQGLSMSVAEIGSAFPAVPKGFHSINEDNIENVVREAVLREQEVATQYVISHQRQERRGNEGMEKEEKDILSERHDSKALKEVLLKMTTDHRTEVASKRAKLTHHNQGNTEIGNGYGVPGGGAYYGAPRPPMFNIASESSHHRSQDHNTLTKGALDGQTSPAPALEVSNNGGSMVGPKNGSLAMEEHPSAESKLEMKELPELLKQRLKARGILKEAKATDVATHEETKDAILIGNEASSKLLPQGW
ncbi:hypothetical protein KI387_010963, partial [Taxus chinensis]